jgi:phage terminase large subunit
MMFEHHKVFGITRKTFPALRMTAYPLFIQELSAMGGYNEANHTKSSPHNYRYGDNTVWFFSLDEISKLKSTEFAYLWLEEADEFTYDDYMILKLRLSGPCAEGERNQIFLSLNPTDGNCWIAQKLVKEKDVEVIHSTYHDNPFLSPDYIQQLEDLINQDENYYRVYVLGEWGKLENLIYHNWRIVPDMPGEWQRRVYGLDFGYENPTVLVKVAVVAKELYVEEVIYQTHMTNSDLINQLKGLPRLDIYADSAEPQRIEEIHRAGFNIYPANKDVKYGIDAVNTFRMNITESSVNTIKEVRGYQRKKDKNGRTLDEPVKFNDHALDAARYAVASIVLPELQPREAIRVYDSMKLLRGINL